MIEEIAENAGIHSLPKHFKSCTQLNGKIDCESVERAPSEYILAIHNQNVDDLPNFSFKENESRLHALIEVLEENEKRFKKVKAEAVCS